MLRITKARTTPSAPEHHRRLTGAGSEWPAVRFWSIAAVRGLLANVSFRARKIRTLSWRPAVRRSRSTRGHAPATGAAIRLRPLGHDRCRLPLLPGPRFCSESTKKVRSMMGSGEARSSKLTARAETHRDRNGLTYPTSSAEQMATPERSLSSARS